MITSLSFTTLGWQARKRSWGICPQWRLFARVDRRLEMRPMAFLDPGAFLGIDLSPRSCQPLCPGILTSIPVLLRKLSSNCMLVTHLNNREQLLLNQTAIPAIGGHSLHLGIPREAFV